MASLLDTIRKNSAALATEKQGVTDNTQQVAGLLRTKRGKAGVAPEVGMSNLEEQQAVSQTNQTMQSQIAPQAALQQAGAEQAARAEEQSAQLQKADIAQNRRFNEVENRLKVEEALNAFERDMGQLDLNKNRAQVEQFGQNLRLTNQKYVNDLQREGARARLDNDINFEQEYTKQAFDNNEEFLSKVFKNQSVANMSDRDFQKQLAQMGIDDAYAAFNAERKAAKERGMYEGLGKLAGAGVAAAGTDWKSPSGTPAAEPNMSKSTYASGSSGAPMSTGTPGSYKWSP